MNKTSIALTLVIQGVCWSLIITLLVSKTSRVAQASVAMQTSPTPVPFLGHIYYGREDVLNVFDHNLPWASVGDDGNDFVLHHDGTPHMPVTDIPQSTPVPSVTPTAAPTYIPGGYGYDEHAGIDYYLQYEPILAAADGTVTVAGWNNPSNHRAGYGLYVTISHGNYRTIYGHLSSLIVKQGDQILIGTDNRHIIGISGNTGSVLGGCSAVGQNPLCGAHLHFEVRSGAGYSPVNPYGWISTPVIDPWPSATAGSSSYQLWVTPPALVSYADQYPGANAIPLTEPEVNDARIIIDNSSPDFTTSGSCWSSASGSDSFNNEYRHATINGTVACTAKWSLVPDAFSPPDDYDLWVHVPDASNVSLSAVYTIKYNAKDYGEGIVVQAAYPNEEHDAWAYLGRYDFEMAGEEEIQMDTQTILDDPTNQSNTVLADAVRLAPVNPTTPPKDVIYTSFDTTGLAGNVAFEDEDILGYNTHTDEWFMYFDGSDVGLSTVNVDAFYLMGDGSILLSFDLSITLSGVGAVYDSDIVQFTPDSLGNDTDGTFAMYREAEELGLNTTNNNHDIDAISFTPSGVLLVSLRGTFGSFADEDLLQEIDNEPPLALYFDGSDVGLTTTSEGLDGAWVDGSRIYLSTKGTFSVTGSSGDGGDIFTCTPGSTGNTTTCTFGWSSGVELFWNGSAHGLMKIPSTTLTQNIDGFFLGSLVNCPPPNCSFELQFVSWEKVVPQPDKANWLLSTEQKHTGLFSARGQITTIISSDETFLLSSLMGINDQGPKYRFSFYGKGIVEAGDPNIHVWVYADWYDNGVPVGDSTAVGNFDVRDYSNWTPFSTDFICPPVGADTVQFVFELRGSAFNQQIFSEDPEQGSIYIDDVLMETLEGNYCPLLNRSEK